MPFWRSKILFTSDNGRSSHLRKRRAPIAVCVWSKISRSVPRLPPSLIFFVISKSSPNKREFSSLIGNTEWNSGMSVFMTSFKYIFSQDKTFSISGSSISAAIVGISETSVSFWQRLKRQPSRRARQYVSIWLYILSLTRQTASAGA